MKTLVLWALLSLLALSGMALGHPSEENEKGSSMGQMMGGESGGKSMSMPGGMMGMMQRMNTMMDQCSRMMHSAHGQEHEKPEGKEEG